MLKWITSQFLAVLAIFAALGMILLTVVAMPFWGPLWLIDNIAKNIRAKWDDK